MIKFSENVKQKYPQYLNDESNIVTNGFAERIYFPADELQVQKIMLKAIELKTSVTISGGGTGISGGRVPLGGWIIASDNLKSISEKDNELWKDPETKIEYQVKLNEIDENNANFTVPTSMTVKSIQNYVREKNWFYGPDPTERTSFIGGNVATNASGARCFKFGATRRWVQKLRIILPDSTIIELDRKRNNGSIGDKWITLNVNNKIIKLKKPQYAIPDVTKNVAGLVITDNMHPIDIFIGTNGIFGIITQVTIKLIRPPYEIVSIFAICKSMRQALKLVQLCQNQRARQQFPVPLSVELLDDRAVKIMQLKDESIKQDAKAIIILEQDSTNEKDLDKALKFWNNKLIELKITSSLVAQSHSEIEHHKFLRHSVPDYIIALTKTFNQSLIVTDYSVPIDKTIEIFEYAVIVGHKFEKFQNEQNSLQNPGYVLLAHAGDNHIHLALIPRSKKEAEYANKLIVKMMYKIIELGGSIAAEHGLGKKQYDKKPALYFQYGDNAINDIKLIKLKLDPHNLLNPHNIVG